MKLVSIRNQKAWAWIIVGVLLAGGALSCGNNSPDTTPKVSLASVKKEYRGGLYKVWVSVPVLVTDLDDVRWVTGKAGIANRMTTFERNEMIADTVYLHWEELPEPILELDTIKGDSGLVARVDSTIRYIDSIGVVIQDVPSPKIAIEIYNILPKIDSIWIGGRGQAGDSTILLAGNPGEKVRVQLRPYDALDTGFAAVYEWPVFGDAIVTELADDSLDSWSVRMPTQEMDTVLPFRVMDTGGYGIRTYNLHVVSYQESGSVWAAATKDLVKISKTGSEVMRLSQEFKRISDIILNPNNNQMWVLDQDDHALYYYDTFGRMISKDSTTFVSPLSVAIDVESGFLWVSDLINPDSSISRIGKYDLSSPDSLRAVGTPVLLQGPIKGFSIDQFERDLLWFVSPESDFVGYIQTASSDVRIFDEATLNFRFNRPSMVSYDPVAGYAWVADSSRVIVMDTAGTIQAEINGFSFVSSLSAAGGVCWISDVLTGEVVRFTMAQVDGAGSGDLKVDDGLRVSTFVSPISVSTFAKDNSVWVADRETGQVILLRSDGSQDVAVAGLKLPSLVRVHQVVE
jgi:hypothetical protein